MVAEEVQALDRVQGLQVVPAVIPDPHPLVHIIIMEAVPVIAEVVVVEFRKIFFIILYKISLFRSEIGIIVVIVVIIILICCCIACSEEEKQDKNSKFWKVSF